MIGIYGDSFGDINPQEMINLELDRAPWPLILSDMLGKKAESHAKAATSVWWSYKNFLKTYKKYDTIVFCYSNYDRWANINSYPYSDEDQDDITFKKLLGLSHVFHEDQLAMVKEEDMNIAKIIVAAHPYLYSRQLNIFLYQTLFNDINRICKEEDIKLINLLSFEEFGEAPILSLDASYGTCLTNLLRITDDEFSYVNEKGIDDRLKALENKPDRRFCHINPYNNKILATIIKESLYNNTKYLNLGKDSRFSFDIKHLEYLL